MAATQELLHLVERFERNRDAYRSGRYNETQLRREFLDPFFKLLGWDVDNERGYAEAYKEVIHEDAVKIGALTKAPDYAFRIGGVRKFFVEAKNPSKDLKTDPEPAFQLRRYAWSAKLPLSILSDFEEFVVYDCRVKPQKTDKASVARTMYLKYGEYADHWEEITEIFSREAILKGSFDRYAESRKKKRGTAEVDEVFLKQIEDWRELLAKNLALRNPKLTVRELNVAVQRTIDRMIFLRICEDRAVEDYGQLQGLTNAGRIYRRLGELFQRADQRYNSGLFHFLPEKGRHEPPDELTLGLDIEDKVLKEIITGLYYPDSPYEFSVLSADILGQVYEQFLGKVIRLTAGHRAVVEDKPEVKKAGGVYYTPTYVVQYIVDNTVGELLGDKTPKQAADLKILDPACGSGSFLIEAYQKLLDWHRDWYVEHGAERYAREKKIYEGPGGEWRLTTTERKRILLNNIYGVDIDPQAVEVTKLSLLLKVLEGESAETIQTSLRMYHERALPDLGDNIKCGNSLIAADCYDGMQFGLLEPEERERVNAFDWQREFSPVFTGGHPGFDAVIGNPPYIPIETMTEYERDYYQAHHPELQRKFDSAAVFILAMAAKLSQKGRLGFISSLTWQTGENYANLRRRLLLDFGLSKVVNLPFDVFRAAYVDTGVYIITRQRQRRYEIYRFPKKARVNSLSDLSYTTVPIRLVTPPDYKLILDPTARSVLERCISSDAFVALGRVTTSTQGLAAGRFRRATVARGTDWWPFLEEGQVYRYRFLVERTSYADMGDYGTLRRFYEAEPKVLIRRVVNRDDRVMAAYIDQTKLVFKKDVNPFVIADKDSDGKFITGIVNSRLFSYLYVNASSIATKDDFRQTTLAELRRMPIPRYDSEEATHAQIRQCNAAAAPEECARQDESREGRHRAPNRCHRPPD